MGEETSALSPQAQWKAVEAETGRTESGAGRTTQTEAEDGVVKVLYIPEPNVTDLSPLRALTHLERLNPPHVQITDLSFLSGMKLKQLGLSPIRRSRIWDRWRGCR